ncbi:MAG TPA: acyl-CoA dehydrogenase family protein [Streptosporangiaceae bacterium]|nr:acyl-CoA dehydrogenase family protein [Streptosporangiaceae bacterium]
MTEEDALRDAIRDVLSRSADAAWAGLAAVGVPGLAVPEKYGGAGASLAEVGIAVAEAGRVLLPEPVLSTTLAAAVLAEAGAGGGAAEFLPDLAAGRLKAAFVFTGDIREADGRLTGTAEHVLDGVEAGLLLVRAGEEMFAVQAGDFVMTQMGVLDQTRSQGVVRFDRATAARTGVSAARAEDLLRVLLAVESAAAAAYCLEATVTYLKTRVQFGRPLAGFQALRHRCADLAVEVASAAATAQAAIERPYELAALAKLYCADVFWHVAAEMVQLHGGIGITWEHQAHRYLKRAKTTQLLLGSPSELRAVIAARAGLLAA